MYRFGLTNIYLKAGVLLIVAALLCVAWMAFFGEQSSSLSSWISWFSAAGFLAGLILYAIGRLAAIVGSRDAANRHDAVAGNSQK